ncbi:MAG: lysylphosphatidylglycerol synthase transmembrane domain-containing protein, partial [Dehalococcoidia bacterium]
PPIGAPPRYPGARSTRAVPQPPPIGGSAPGTPVTTLPERLARLVRAAGDGLRAIAPSRVARAALWTVPSWILEGGVVLIAARTMGIGLSVPVAVAVTAVTILFQIVHLTPGGLGVYEASMAGALALHGLPLEQGVTLAVIAHGMKFAYALVIGGVCAALATRAVVRSRAGRDASRPYEVAAVGARFIAPAANDPTTPLKGVARP